MTEHHFTATGPVDLYVEIGKGRVHVLAIETETVTVRLEGRDAEQVHVEQSGDQVAVVGPRQRGGFFGGESALRVDVTVPHDSNVAVRTGSADIELEGPMGGGQLRSGSGDVRVDALGTVTTVETGSGDVRVDDARGELRVKSGSGDVTVGHAASDLVISTGSGDVEVGTALGATVAKTGSGDLAIRESHADVTMRTGSGDLAIGTVHRGRIGAKGASGDVTLGVPAGVPVWTDITTVSGSIRSGLAASGEPREGQDHVELRATTVSGDVVLVQR